MNRKLKPLPEKGKHVATLVIPATYGALTTLRKSLQKSFGKGLIFSPEGDFMKIYQPKTEAE